jgi:hypothetical protein
VIVGVLIFGHRVAIVHFVDLILGLAFALQANIIRALSHAIGL